MTGAARTLLLALLVASAALAAAVGVSSATEPKTTLPAMEQQVMCVVCRTPLSVANGPQADAQRRQIRRLIAEGKSEQQIKDVMVAQYGQRALALPDEGGFNLAVYLVPVGALALALAVLAVMLPRWRRGTRERAAQPAAAAAPAPSAEELRRLDEDLARHD